ncbi:MAG: long-chain-fatty-acid--CoA ligase, partial [Betaproteobacteria bacterium]
MLQHGLIMECPLLISAAIRHAETQYGSTVIASKETHGAMFHYTYADCARRSRQLAHALRALGLQAGQCVATLAWSNHRHLEAYFAVSGAGMVLHTCNPRLHPEQLAYIINHADDRAVLFDATFAPLVKVLAPNCPYVKSWICLADSAHMPDPAGLPGLLCYDQLLDAQSPEFEWPEFDERTAAALCYTSGTTGNPKGVLYSHRAIVLSAMAIAMPGALALSPAQTVLPVVPMFHVNAWCIPYAAAMSGAKLVLPGPQLDGKNLYELMEAEGVTVSAGVPTIWHMLALHLDQTGKRFSTMRRSVVGGSAMPLALLKKFVEEFNVEVLCGWGMTETTAAATVSGLTPAERLLDREAQHQISVGAGKCAFGLELKIVDEHGMTLPRDGKSPGELYVRGLWVLSGYFKADASPLRDGWFPTGDMATLGGDGELRITDRAKDVIKTGGEWISSIDVENAAMAHPAVAMAAVIGVRHPKWDERPLIFIVRKPGQAIEKEEVLSFLSARMAKWWVPDEVVFLESLPLSGTGKVLKMELRKQYA